MTEINYEERLERIRMIKDSADSIVPNDNNMSRVRELRFTANGIDEKTWREICDMGWTGIRLSDEEGGSGLGVSESVALLEAFGRGLVPEPLIDAIFVASLLPESERKALISGESLILPAGFNYQQQSTATLKNGKLSGSVEHLYYPQAADAFLVYTDQGLALVDKSDATLISVETQDGGHKGTLTFNQITPKMVIKVDHDLITQQLDYAALSNSAYLLGVMQEAFNQTLDYINIRKQFGRAIGSFQVLQHRMVDLKIQLELSRAIIDQAANAIDNGDEIEHCRRLVSTAKIRASNAALLITRQAIQLHGAIGYTDEADIGLFLRKTMVLMNRYGTTEEHKQRYIDLAYGEE